jgi:hypothetical protein
MRKAALLSSVAVFCVFSGNAFSQNGCGLFLDQMKDGSLYESEPSCHSSFSDCVKIVTPNADFTTGLADVSLSPNKVYNFYYRTEGTPVTKSLVAVQVKYLEATPRARTLNPVGVSLERDATPFACDKTLRKDLPYRYGKYVDNQLVDTVDYDEYDQYHRWGRFSGDVDAELHENFHIRYNNGDRCVRSDEGHRAQLFLMHGRNTLPSRWEEAIYRAGLSKVAENLKIPSAYAQYAKTPSERKALKQRVDIVPFSQLKVLLTNYQKKELTSGCFGFSVATNMTDRTKQPSELDVSFSDLEESVTNFPHPHWNYQAIYRFAIK